MQLPVKKFATYLIISIILTLGLSISMQSLLAAWTAPSASPPGNNISKPLYATSSVPQMINKESGSGGSLGVEGSFSVGDESYFADNVGILNDTPDYALVVGPVGGGRHLVINDCPDARWGFSTGGYDLAIQNDFDGTGDCSGGGDWNSRIIINQDGNVGIGDIDPGYKFHVTGGSGFFNTNSNNDPFIIGRNYEVSDFEELRIGVVDQVATVHYINDEASNRIDFKMENTDTESGGGVNENNNIVLSILGNINGGNVGIGTTNPLAALSIKQPYHDWFSGITLRDYDSDNTWALVQASTTDLYIGYADDASGANETSDFDPFVSLSSNGLKINGSVEIEVDDEDSKIKFNDPGDYHYSMGIDRSDNGKFKINVGEEVGYNTNFTMTSNGDVGLGTTSPEAKLHVAGKIRSFATSDSDPGDTLVTKSYLEPALTYDQCTWLGATTTCPGNTLMRGVRNNGLELYCCGSNPIACTETGWVEYDTYCTECAEFWGGDLISKQARRHADCSVDYREETMGSCNICGEPHYW